MELRTLGGVSREGADLHRGPFLDGLHLESWGEELEGWLFDARERPAGLARTALLAGEAVGVAEARGRPDRIVGAIGTLAWPLSCTGAYDEAEACGRQALAFAGEHGLEPTELLACVAEQPTSWQVVRGRAAERLATSEAPSDGPGRSLEALARAALED